MEGTSKKRIRCAVNQCQTRKTETSILFKFPRDDDRARVWCDKLGLKRKPRIIKYVCIDHFEKDQIVLNGGRPGLKRTAVPTLRITPYGVPSISEFISIKSEGESSLADTIDKRDSLAVYKENLKRMKPHLKFSKKTNEELIQLLKLSRKYLPKSLSGVIDLQVQLQKSHLKTKLTPEYKAFALHLYYTSPLAYEHLQNILQLPTVKSLKNSFLPSSLDIDEDLVSNLKIKVDMMTDKQKYCTLCVDVIDLNPDLYYIINRDRIVGFHEVNGKRTKVVATKAIVAMARGVLIDWVQPTGMVLVADAVQIDLLIWIKNLISKLLDIDLNIIALVMDINMATYYNLIMTLPSISVNNRSIHCVFDVPYLLTDMRNDFVENNFEVSNKVAKWLHVLWCHNYESKRKYSLVPKLKDEHLKPKLSRNEYDYAIKLFRHSTAAAISNLIDFNSIANLATDTCEFISKISDLFDLLTSNTPQSEEPFKKGLTLEEKQINFLHEMMSFFKNLTLTNKQNKTNYKMTPLFANGFIITINSLIKIKSELNPKYKYLLTRRFSLDCIRTFFNECQKKCKHERVTAKQVVFKFKEYFASQLLISPVQSTVKDDLNDIFTQIQEIKDIQKYENAVKNFEYTYFDHQYRKYEVKREVYKHFKSSSRRQANDDIPGIADFILEQCYNAHVCSEHDLRIESCKSVFTNCVRKNFAKYVSTMNKIFIKRFYKNESSSRLLKDLLSDLAMNIADNVHLLCKCFPYYYAKLLFARMRIREELRYLNYKFNNEERISFLPNLEIAHNNGTVI